MCFLFLCRKVIQLTILEEGSYEKDVLLYVNIGEPQMVGGKLICFMFCLIKNSELEICFCDIHLVFTFDISRIEFYVCCCAINV